MIKVLIPGLHNSDENHWQTHFEREFGDDCVRIQQENWDEPDCELWVIGKTFQLANSQELPDQILSQKECSDSRICRKSRSTRKQ